MVREQLVELPKERELGLKGIWRYSMVETMFYRTNVWLHSRRVFWIIQDIMPAFRKVYPRVNADKAAAMALVHDDPELVMGDVQAGHKIWMSRGALRKLHNQEAKAIREVAAAYPVKIGKFSYAELMREAAAKRSLESQLVSYADKMDAYCESLHELTAGNVLFIEPVALYVSFFARLESKLPGLAGIEKVRSVFADPFARVNKRRIDRAHYGHLGRPHTAKSILLPTNFPFYDRWKHLTVSKGGSEGTSALVKRREK